ncbi:hypothetical protein E4U42_008024 [Claviceps africana]|uniref:Oxidoreductase-like domain-containing protein n=1 Tax=Claviceps africana TaxID=83212 RepID=A0A8K0NED5_9HYPO|nr:hypothetical protein E4U42_008024 [Claviceps africana]
MSAPTRIATSRLCWVPLRLTASTRSFAASCSSLQDLDWPQRMPLGDYYTSILRDPTPVHDDSVNARNEPPRTADRSAPPPSAHARSGVDKRDTSSAEKNKPSAPARESTTATTDSSSPSAPRESTPTPQEKARIIFGSRLLGPAEQADKLALKEARSTYVAGVLVPPQPEEPDNCCMSGCVNCVWDRFREDMEEWSAKKHEAQARASQAAGAEVKDADGHGRSSGTSPLASGGNDQTARDNWDDEVYRGVPVGFREFMKQEKRLKERHAREGTVGG